MSFAPAPPEMSLEQRIAMTASARDADVIPKVAGAGSVFTDESGERVQLMHNGLKVVADGYCGAWMTDLIERCRGHHEPQEELAFHTVVGRLSERAAMLEIGANWGYYSLWFLKDHPARRALLIEPDASGLALARKNLALNGLGAEAIYGYVGTGYAALIGGLADPPPRVNLDELLASRQVARLDLLHCDAQGAELELIEESANLLRDGRVDWLFLSTHGAPISGDPLTHQKCLARLQSLGARIVADHDVHESFSGDGLIVARFGGDEGEPFPALSRNRYSTSYYRNPLYDLAAEDPRMKAADAAEIVAEAYSALHGRAAPRDEIAGAVADVASGVTPAAALVERFLRPRAATPDDDAGGPTRTVGRWLQLNADSALGRAGERVLTPIDGVMTPYLLEHGQWQTESLDLAKAHLDVSAAYTLVDIGANIGMFTRQVLTAFGAIRRCLCVEPDPRNVEALCANLRKFEEVEIEVFPFALAGTTGTATFYRDAENIGNYSLQRDAMRNRQFDETQTVALDAGDWARAHLGGSERIILKTDTQGSDEAIAVRIPLDIWRNVAFASLEIWRIEKPPFDAAIFRAIVESFPHWSFRGARNCPVQDILDYASGKDWMFYDLYLWR